MNCERQAHTRKAVKRRLISKTKATTEVIFYCLTVEVQCTVQVPATKAPMLNIDRVLKRIPLTIKLVIEKSVLKMDMSSISQI